MDIKTRIQKLLEAPEQNSGRLETRTMDDPEQGSMSNEFDTGDEFDNPEGNAEGENSFQDGMDDGMDNDDPDFGAIEEPDNDPVVDDNLWAMVSSHDYVTDYEHAGNETVHPRLIASFDKAQLTKLQSSIDNMIASHEMDKNNHGLYNDTTYEYLIAMKSFTQTLIDNKAE